MSVDALPPLILHRTAERLLECTPAGPVPNLYLAAMAAQARRWPEVVDALHGGQTLALWLTKGCYCEAIHCRLQKHWQQELLRQTEPRKLVVPIHYDGEDLERVAEHCQLTPDEVVAIHSGVNYRVAWLGFLPGFAYLDGLPEALHLPRRQTPRIRVPAGSLAIAGSQSALYPSESPGGWHLIGRCELELFNPSSASPSFFLPGDNVRFITQGRRP